MKKPSLKISAVSNWGPLVVNFVVGLLLTPFLMEHLGKPRYGIWTLVSSFLGYYGLLRLGVGSSIMRYVPFYRGTNEQKNASQIVSTSLALFIVAGTLILVISLSLAKPIAQFYEGGAELESLIRILGVVATVECLHRVFEACVRSYEHWVAMNFIIISKAIVRALGFIGCIHWGFGVVGMGYVVLAICSISSIIVFFLFKRFCPDIRLHPSLVKLSSLHTLVSFGILTTIITLASSLKLQGYSLIIGKLISLEAVAIYAIPVLLIKNIRLGLSAPARVFWPRFAYLDGKNQLEKVASLFLRGTRFTAIFTSGVILLVFILGPSFIGLWMDEDFTAAYPVLLLLAVGTLIGSSQAITSPFLGGTGYRAIEAVFASIECILAIGLGIILTKQIGLTGPAFGFVTSITVIHGIICPWYVCRLLKISLLQYYARYLLRPWLILGIFSSLWYTIGISEYVNSWLVFILATIIVAILYTLCIYLLVLNLDEKTELKVYISRILKQVKIRNEPM